jgi:hypothetical protein
MNRLRTYKNGNYLVEIYEDGTKYRLGTPGKELKPRFPESIDLKITNHCDMGCPMCHENSTDEGVHGKILKREFIETLKAGTELAIGGGNPLDHPDLEEFLVQMKFKGVICNMTVHQYHFMMNRERLFKYIQSGYIKSLGVSLSNSKDAEFVSAVHLYDNIVLHVINGLFTEGDYERLKDKNIKILILGYKIFGRGIHRYGPDVQENMKYLLNNIGIIKEHFKIVSFDNLSIDQLNMRRFFSDSDWDAYYMGDDGKFTMYIDLVKKEFAVSSTSIERYKIKKNIKSMFKIVRKKSRILKEV